MNRFARLFSRTALAVAFATAAVAGHAQDAASYPTNRSRSSCRLHPGGSDFMGRLLAKQLTEKLGQPFIVENKPGAGGNLGAEIAVKVAGRRLHADAHRRQLHGQSVCLQGAVRPRWKDITPIAQLARGPFIIAVTPSLPAKTLKELVDLAKKRRANSHAHRPAAAASPMWRANISWTRPALTSSMFRTKAPRRR